MKQRKNDLPLVIGLTILSLALYMVHFFVFKDIHHITIFALSDLAFVPFEVLCVTLIFHRLLSMNEKKKRISKLYMIIELFFAEIGTELLRAFAQCDDNLEEIHDKLEITPSCGAAELKSLGKTLTSHQAMLELSSAEFEAIDMMLQECRPQMLSMLANPALLEHETFTDVLMAVFHLTEELRMRYDFKQLTDSDKEHLTLDAHRAYELLRMEWFDYADHTRVHYPYLYSLCIRTNPFKPYREVEVI